MNTLFNDIENDSSDAIFSDCRKYRYALWRIWNRDKPHIMFIGFNPSTANENVDDNTIRRVKDFAKRWGYGGVYMMNIFAWVTAYPEELLKCDNPVGDNDKWLFTVSGMCKDIIFAWGNFNVFDRDKKIIKMFPDAKCLGKNKNGSPKHPLYLSKETELKNWL